MDNDQLLAEIENMSLEIQTKCKEGESLKSNYKKE